MRLDIEHLSHWYGDRQVLNNVSFSVTGGHLTGFVGANGAGKTTTMRAVLGLVKPREGRVLLDGNPITDTDRARFGYMPEERGLYPKMPLGEQIVYFAMLHGLDKSTAERRTAALLDRLELADRAKEQVQALSLGNQQRAQICVALVHEPDFLMLDEPFSGLDPVAVDVVLQVLHEQAARGVPVLFSSHQLDVVERLSDELVIISNGVIREAGNRLVLQEQHSRGLYRIEVDDPAWLASAGVELVPAAGEGSVFRVPGDSEDATDAAAQQVLQRALAHGPVRRFHRELTPLTQIFREVR